MTDILVREGQRVKRGDRLGSIGNVAGDGRSFGAHLHHVHWRRATKASPWERIKMRFMGEPLAVSVGDSDTRPSTWDPPEPQLVTVPRDTEVK
jgi:murein DD-endopeptidase MepM/ murein hydrolase activator NlpD